MKLTTVRLLITDFARSLKFWRDVMKLAPKYEMSEMGYAYFDFGGLGLELFSRKEFNAALNEDFPTGPTVQTVLDFLVDDVDTAYTELVELGATPIHSPFSRPDWGVRVAHVADPDGHIIEIYSKPGE